MMKLTLYAALLLPWLTLFFADRHSLKRYAPVVILTTLMVTITMLVGSTAGLWTIHKSVADWGHSVDISFAFGVLPVATFWIFYWTYRRFWVFAAVNAALDLFLPSGNFYVLEKLGIASFHLSWLVRLSLVLLSFGQALLLFVYQRWQEGIMVQHEPRSPEGSGSGRLRLAKFNPADFGLKEKAK